MSALSKSLRALNDGTEATIPSEVLQALAPIAEPGTHVKIDMEASETLGAPLVTLTKRPEQSDLLAPLTQRQREVAKLMIKGKSNRDIAADLSISIATVKDHVHAILQRLELPTRAAVIAAARS